MCMLQGHRNNDRLLLPMQVWIQKYDEEMGAAEQIYQEELAQTNQVGQPKVLHMM